MDAKDAQEQKNAEKMSLINFLSLSDLCLCLEELLVEYKRKRKVVEICYKFGEFPTCGRHGHWWQSVTKSCNTVTGFPA